MPLADLAKAYKAAEIPAHRFALPLVAKAIASPSDADQLASEALSAQLVGISLQDVLDTLEQDSGNTTYEKLECLGLEHQTNSDRLVATFHLNQPSGYSGRPCTRGSTEYVAFGPTGTTTASSSTSAPSRPTSTTTAASCPGAASVTRPCCPSTSTRCARAARKPVLRRVRAVLSWGVPPSTTNPNLVPYWGNRLDTHVEIAPGRPYDGKARFTIVGGVPASEIDPSTGLTKPVAHLAVNGTPLDPHHSVAGRVTLHGPTDPVLVGSTYRVRLTNLTTGAGPFELMTDF